MKAEFSALKFESFYVTEISYEFEFDSGDSDIDIDNQPYEIDIDFLPNNSKDLEFPMYMRLSVNRGKNRLPGHSVYVSAGGYFKINNDPELPESTLDNLRNLSPLTMLIGSVRSYIKLISSNTPTGGYLLPSVSVFNLVKAKTQKKKRTPRKISPKHE